MGSNENEMKFAGTVRGEDVVVFGVLTPRAGVGVHLPLESNYLNTTLLLVGTFFHRKWVGNKHEEC